MRRPEVLLVAFDRNAVLHDPIRILFDGWKRYLDLVTDQGKGTLDRRLYELHTRGVVSVALRHELCIELDMYQNTSIRCRSAVAILEKNLRPNGLAPKTSTERTI